MPERYASRVSGPLRDRIDLWVMLPRVAPSVLVRGPAPEQSRFVGERIAAARVSQLARSRRLNARIDGRRLRVVCRLSATAERRLVELADLAGLSARGTSRLLRVARTIADLAGDSDVDRAHLDEAGRFRPPPRTSARLAKAV